MLVTHNNKRNNNKNFKCKQLEINNNINKGKRAAAATQQLLQQQQEL